MWAIPASPRLVRVHPLQTARSPHFLLASAPPSAVAVPPRWAGGSPLELDGEDARAEATDLGEGGGGEVDDAVGSRVRTSVPDDDVDGAPVGGVGDLDDRPERQGCAGARQAPDAVPGGLARGRSALAAARRLVGPDELDLVARWAHDVGGGEDGAH